MTQNKKNFLWNTIGCGLNSFNSLFFMIVVTRINGIKDAGIFSLCFATASMLYIIAIYSGRTYQITETDKNVTDVEYIIHRFLSSIIMLIVGIIWILINGYTKFKTVILLLLCVFKITEAIADVFYGIMQKNERLDLAGISMFIKGILNIIMFCIINFLTKNLILSCISLIITNIIILLCYDLKYVKKYKEKRISKDINTILKIFTFGFYTFLYTLICNYLFNIPRYSIDSILSPEFQTIYGIIIMPASIIMVANMFIIQPVITKLKTYFKKGNKKDFNKLTNIIIFITILIGIIASILAYFLGVPVLNFIYNIDLKDYLNGLIIIIIGATFYTVSSVLSNCLLIIRETKIQVIIYIVVSLLSICISNKLVKIHGIMGGIYSYLIMMFMLLSLYIIIYSIKIKKIGIKEI